MPKSRSRSKTRKIPTNSRGAHSDRASSAQSDPAAKNHSDSSYTSSDHSPRIQSRHASNHHTDRESHRNSENVSKPVSIDKLNATQIESTGLHFNSSYLFTFSGIIQCTCLVIFWWPIDLEWLLFRIKPKFSYSDSRGDRICLRTFE